MNEKVNDTKTKIYEAAIALFQEKGFDNVTIRDICAASAISKHTFYYYFESKDALLMSFRDKPWEMADDCLEDVLSAENHIEQYLLLSLLMTQFFERMGPEIGKRIITLNVNQKSDSLEKTRMHRLRSTKIGLMRKAQESGEIRNSSGAEVLDSICFALTFSTTFHWSMGGGRFDLYALSRGALENALDVRPDLRKIDEAMLHMPKIPIPESSQGS